MTANIHSKTGIPFGAICGYEVPDLMNEIVSNGTNLSYESWKGELRDRLVSACKEAKLEHADAQRLRTALRNVLHHYTYERRLQQMLDIIDYEDILETRNETEEEQKEDFDDIVKDLLNAGLSEEYEDSDDEYIYQKQLDQGLVKYQLGWLGGSALIWVLESPWLLRCRGCSSCVPNAGNLEEPAGSVICYSLPPDEYPEGYVGKPFLVNDQF